MILMPGANAYDRRIDGLPPIECQNLYPESTPSEIGTDWVLIQTPGQRSFGGQSAPFGRRGLFSAYGVFDGDVFSVIENVFSRIDSDGNATIISTAIPGDDKAIFTSVRGYVVFTAGGVAFAYDGTTLTQVSDPDLPRVTSVAAMDGRIVFMEEGSDRIWWSGIFDPTNVDALAFATAETFEDELVRIIADHRELWLFGQQTIEIWRPVADFEQPFQRIGDMVIEKGTLSPHSVAKADSGLLWVGQDAIIYLARGVNYTRISNHGIELELESLTEAELADVFGFTYTDNGHVFYVVTIPNRVTYVYDLATQAWHTRTTGGESFWAVEYAVAAFSGTYVLNEDGVSELSRRFISDTTTITLSKPGNPIFNNLIFRRTTLVIPSHIPTAISRIALTASILDPSGAETNAGIELSFSDDAGRTFSNPETAEVHANGQYNQRTTFFRHGQLRHPGRVYLIEYVSLDNASSVLLGPVLINEALH